MMTTKKGWTCLRWISRAYDRYQASSGPNGKINMLPILVGLPSASDGPPRSKASLMIGKVFPMSPLRLVWIFIDFMSIESMLFSNVSLSDITNVNK